MLPNKMIRWGSTILSACGLFGLPSLAAAHSDIVETPAQYAYMPDPLGQLLNNQSAQYPYAAQSAAGNLFLSAQSALVMNTDTGEILYEKGIDQVRPIASISKLMAAMVVLDGGQDMNEVLNITSADIDRLKGTGSRLDIGTGMTRREMLHIGLMSSENRAIHALGRNYPGGMSAFVAAMNSKAQQLGMTRTRFYEPTGLDPRNVSTARELSHLVAVAHQYPLIRQFSTANNGHIHTARGRAHSFRNTNALIREGQWNITLQKTGYIRESGRSMVVHAYVGGQPLTIVLLNAPSPMMRTNDAHSIQTWVSGRSI